MLLCKLWPHQKGFQRFCSWQSTSSSVSRRWKACRFADPRIAQILDHHHSCTNSCDCVLLCYTTFTSNWFRSVKPTSGMRTWCQQLFSYEIDFLLSWVTWSRIFCQMSDLSHWELGKIYFELQKAYLQLSQGSLYKCIWEDLIMSIWTIGLRNKRLNPGFFIVLQRFTFDDR